MPRPRKRIRPRIGDGNEITPRSLDALDPPRWGPVPHGATGMVRRCYALRSKPIDEFNAEDLRLMIGQKIALRHLIPLALGQLAHDPLAEGNLFPGDLLPSVIRIERSFWTVNPGLAQQLHDALDRLPTAAEVAETADQQLADEIATFRSSTRL